MQFIIINFIDMYFYVHTLFLLNVLSYCLISLWPKYHNEAKSWKFDRRKDGNKSKTWENVTIFKHWSHFLLVLQ